VAKRRRTVGTGTSTRRRRRRRDFRVLRWLLLFVALVVGGGVWFVWPYWRLAGSLASETETLPSRLYARAVRLEAGMRVDPDALVRRLEGCGYRPAPRDGLLPGTYRALPRQVAISQRRFPSPRGWTGGGLLVIDLAGDRIERLHDGAETLRSALLEPYLLASWYGPELRDRVPVPLDEIPRDLVQAVLAAEDDGFFEHPGLSLSGIARALWTNLRGGTVRQGGSTLTQQLVKNRFLSAERTLERKLREALLALFVELRYEKREILRIYLDSIFWGKPGPVNLMGVGAAARAYFDKPAAELDLAEAALLAGIIRAPAELSPYRRPEAALARRNQILDRLVALRWVASERAEAAKAAPLGVRATGYGQNRAPFFAAAVAAEARRRYGVESLADAGLILLSTLDEVEQAAATAAVEAGVADLAGRVGERGAPLQAALVALDPLTGGARAWVGGRDFRASQFDRVSQMRRQAGSTFKPVVYAAAFAGEVATPATLIADEPLLLELAGRQWSPKNDDGEFLGWISARTAVERSRNLPTVRLALEVGLPPIVDLARRLGVASPLSPVPALALGAFELSPLELATVYSVFASGGVRPPVHTLDGVLDGRGQPLAGTPLPPPERVLSPEAAYLVTSLLEGVVAHGTGQRARQLGLTDPVAGKTGTTNQKRDAWFAGFAPGKVALAWVGYDDNRPTPFSGAAGALPVWTGFMLRTRPPGGYGQIAPPAGVVRRTIDPASGGLALPLCPQVIDEFFLASRAPTLGCPLHGGPRWAGDRLGAPPPEAEEGQGEPESGRFRRWLRRLFGGAAAPPQG